MSDNASIARPYAKAIFALAKESSDYEPWVQGLDSLATVTADQTFEQVVADPKINTTQVTDLLLELVKDQLPKGGDNLVRLLVKNNRTSVVSDISAQFQALVAKEQATVNAEVITAFGLSDQQRKDLAAALQQRLGVKVTLEEQIDESLVGGAIVKAGDLVIDGSAQGRLEKLTTALMR
ncbi:MAG: F0F1 ATP synthase subunit delta [Pseudomonadota bacterium]